MRLKSICWAGTPNVPTAMGYTLGCGLKHRAESTDITAENTC